MEQWERLPVLAERLLKELRCIDAAIIEEAGEQDSSEYSSYKLPAHLLTEPENPYVYFILSSFGGLVAVRCDWDVKPVVMGQIKEICDKLDLRLVPYHLFGNPSDNHWRYAYQGHHHMVVPPPGKDVMLNEEIWRRLFDYM